MPFCRKIKVTWSNVSNGEKNVLVAHVVFDHTERKITRNSVTGKERALPYENVESLSCLKFVSTIVNHYGIEFPRVYELDMLHYAFKSNSVPMLTIDPIMEDLPNSKLVVFRYDYSDLKFLNEKENYREGKEKKKNNREADPINNAYNDRHALTNEDVAASFRTLYYRSESFASGEYITDERRASFPLTVSEDEPTFYKDEQWRKSKVYFVWFSGEKRLERCDAQEKPFVNNGGVNRKKQDDAVATDTRGILSSSVETKLFSNSKRW